VYIFLGHCISTTRLLVALNIEVLNEEIEPIRDFAFFKG
jgi:hypothetical protein